MTVHHLEPVPEAVTQFFSSSAPAVLTVDPGDTLMVRTLDAHGYLERPESWDTEPPRMFTPSRGHCLAGPIEVRGAEPGQVLAVHLESMQPGAWGWTTAGVADEDLSQALGVAAGPVEFLAWDLDPVSLTGRANGFTVPLTPFLGVIGMPPAEPGEHSTTPPRTLGGGNLDCRELVAGSTLYLPVTVPGAGLCLGDGHAAQGDGEVSGTAIECGMTSTVTLSLVDDPPLSTIHAVTPRPDNVRLQRRPERGHDRRPQRHGDVDDHSLRHEQSQGARAGQRLGQPADHASGQQDLGRARAPAQPGSRPVRDRLVLLD